MRQAPGVPSVDEVQELADLYVHRPLARPLVKWLSRTPATPNQVTILSGASGVLAAACIASSRQRPVLRLAAALLLFASAVLDCADGQLARRRRDSTPEGSALDGLSDEVVGFALILAGTYIAQERYGADTWLVGGAAMVSSSLQCFLFDVAKERYLARFGIVSDTSKLALAAMADGRSRDHSGSEAGVVTRWLQGMFDGYVGRMRTLARWWPDAARDGRPAARRRMRAWAMLGMGTHMACGYIAAAASFFWLPALYVCLVVFSTVMNVMLLTFVLRDKTAARSAP